MQSVISISIFSNFLLYNYWYINTTEKMNIKVKSKDGNMRLHSDLRRHRKRLQNGSMLEASGFEIFRLNICQEASWWGSDAL